jgi:hypothetical protein
MIQQNCERVTFLRNTTEASAAAPCPWNTFFVKSTPIMRTPVTDALSCFL